jgi:hypothetical protein
MVGDTLTMASLFSVFMQVYSNKRAVFESLKSLRTFYRDVAVRVISDDGENFSEICNAFNATFVHSPTRIVAGSSSAGFVSGGLQEYLIRLYDHCIATSAEWVIIFESDVRLVRHFRSFPETEAAGPRMNLFSIELNQWLVRQFGSRPYGYGMSGGSVFRRESFIKAYRSGTSIERYAIYDSRLPKYGDMALTLLFYLNGYDFSVWSEVSELFHEESPIIRDAAMDHAYKYWYDKPFDIAMLEIAEDGSRTMHGLHLV